MEKDKYGAQKKYAKDNLVKLGIDVKPEIRSEFRKCCNLNNTFPSTELRKFVLKYIYETNKNKNI